MKTKVRFGIHLPLLFLIGFLWSATLFYNKIQDYRQGRLEYQKLRTESVEQVKEVDRKIERKMRRITEEGKNREPERENGKESEETKKEAKNKQSEQLLNEITCKIETDVENKINLLSIKEETLKQYNPDYAFWLTVPDTPIDYPVVSSLVPDYYLNHTFQKQKNSSGCLFIQPSEGGEVENVVIYGHNRKDGSMFGTLKRYEASQFYENHPRLWIYYLGRWYQGLIFSCQLNGQQDFTCYQTEFKDRKDKGEFVKNMKQRSLYPIPVYPAFEDSIITLSTCYESSKRMIVQAVLMCYTE